MCMNLEGNRAVKAITEGMQGRAGGGATKLDAMIVQCFEWKVVANVDTVRLKGDHNAHVV